MPRVRVAPILLALAACTGAAPSLPPGWLPTGAVLDPAGSSLELGSMPLAMAAAPGGRRLVVLLSGYREQGLQVVDRTAGTVVQTLVQPAAFLGLAFGPDSTRLYASGGATDLIYVYAWAGDSAALIDSLSLRRRGEREGSRYPAGLAVSPDGSRLYVAENLGDSLTVIDLDGHRVIQRLSTGPYPYDVLTGPDGAVFVSQWNGHAVLRFTPAAGRLIPAGAIPAGRHPSAMALTADGNRLYVASASTDRISVLDPRAGTAVGVLQDAAPEGPSEGSTPNGLTVSTDGSRLYVAEADNNAVAVFALEGDTGRLLGRVPVEWYPTAVHVVGDTLLVLNAKGRGTSPNPEGPIPGRPRPAPSQYTLGQTTGTLSTIVLPTDGFDALSTRVAQANGWGARRTPSWPPFRHVLYVIKENRTYDQVLGDLPKGDGDTALVFFGRDVTPNHHALAERFGLFDRFFVNAEVSADGHNWSTAAYAADYVEKTVPSQYSGRRPDYDYEGTNRGVIVDNDVNEPGSGYLWDAARTAGVSLRNYGEFTQRDSTGRWVASKPFLAEHTCPVCPGWDMEIPDQRRADAFLEEFRGFVAADTLPQLMLLRLPNDHTTGARAGTPTPRAHMADNDLALGRVVEAVSRSPFWGETVIFVLEDDAQNGPDHVDSHRSPLFVISAYNRPGVIHRFANTTDVLATIAAILGLEPLSQFDYFGRPLGEIFADGPDPTPYLAVRPSVPLDEMNPAHTALGRASRALDFSREDRADDDAFNLVLWRAIKGTDRPYPGTVRMPALEWQRSRVGRD